MALNENAGGGQGDVELTVLLPCLNERETLGSCIEKARRFMVANGVSGEVLVADNGSRDGSVEIARDLGARVIGVAERGYGAALLGGIGAARGRFVIMGDADDSYDFSALGSFMAALRGGADLVVGNRFLGGIAPGAMPWLHRYVGNPVLSFLGRLFFRAPIGDFHCGLRGFRADAIRALGLRTTGMEFASEMVVRAALAGLDIREVPTRLGKDGRSRPPHLKTWRDGWRHLKFLLMYSPRWLFMVPGLAMLIIGLLIGSALYASPRRLGGIAFDLNSFILACFLCMIGVQMLVTGMIIRQYAGRQGFLPASPRFLRLDALLTTDRLVMGAAAIMLAGLGVFAKTVLQWANVDFGELLDPVTPRTVAAGLTLFVIGLQLMFSAFIVGILQIPSTGQAVKPGQDDPEPTFSGGAHGHDASPP